MFYVYKTEKRKLSEILAEGNSLHIYQSKTISNEYLLRYKNFIVLTFRTPKNNVSDIYFIASPKPNTFPASIQLPKQNDENFLMISSNEIRPYKYPLSSFMKTFSLIKKIPMETVEKIYMARKDEKDIDNEKIFNYLLPFLLKA